MPQPRILILRAPGTNCDGETAHAFALAGGRAERLHVNRLLERPEMLMEYQILCLPGGFSYGDDIASGRILASRLRHHLVEPMRRFREAGRLILGICNGFQILIQSGLLLDDDAQLGPPATLAWNASGRFEDRWVRLAVGGSKCVFLAGIETMYLPVAHGEGRFVVREPRLLDQLAHGGQLALRYAGAAYPDNPNGSTADVAGICDATGRVFGLMPHPERYVDPTQHPRWIRGEGSTPGDGFAVFANAVAYFR